MNNHEPYFNYCANRQSAIVDQEQAINHLLQLRAQLAYSDDPLAKWLHGCIEDYIKQPIENRNFKPLDYFLGLASNEPGQRSAATLIKLRLRNGFLKAAAIHIQQQQGLTDWQVCGVLAEQIRRFRTTALTRIQKGIRKANDDLERNLLDAFTIDKETPATQSHLNDILFKNWPE